MVSRAFFVSGIPTYAAVRYIKSDMMLSLDDDVINETCERFHAVPDGCSGFQRRSTCIVSLTCPSLAV